MRPARVQTAKAVTVDDKGIDAVIVGRTAIDGTRRICIAGDQCVAFVNPDSAPGTACFVDGTAVDFGVLIVTDFA